MFTMAQVVDMKLYQLDQDTLKKLYEYSKYDDFKKVLVLLYLVLLNAFSLVPH